MDNFLKFLGFLIIIFSIIIIFIFPAYSIFLTPINLSLGTILMALGKIIDILERPKK